MLCASRALARAVSPPSACPGPGACLPAHPPSGLDACRTGASPKSVWALSHPRTPQPRHCVPPQVATGCVLGLRALCSAPPTPTQCRRSGPASHLTFPPLLSSALFCSPPVSSAQLGSARLDLALPSSPPRLALLPSSLLSFVLFSSSCSALLYLSLSSSLSRLASSPPRTGASSHPSPEAAAPPFNPKAVFLTLS